MNEDLYNLVSQVFSPAAPIEELQLFVGRAEELNQIKDAINEKGQHVLLFGGRGAGKTSLANVTGSIFTNITMAKVTCTRSDTFKTLWEKAFSKLDFAIENTPMGYNQKPQTQKVNFSIPADWETIDAGHIEQILRQTDENIVIIFDEFDIVKGKKNVAQMADTIKTLSDNLPYTTLVIVGIGDKLTKLIVDHPSIERCMMQIELQLMSNEESGALIENGIKLLCLQIEKEVKQGIIDYACGFPHYLHLLCKFACLSAIKNECTNIGLDDFNHAVKKSIENSTYSLRNSFKLATSSTQKKSQFEDVLAACALSKADPEHSFTSDDLLKAFNIHTQQNARMESISYNLGMLCKKERGNILEKTGKTRNPRYKFKNPLMKAFIKLKVLHHGNLS